MTEETGQDLDSEVARKRYAVIYTPSRRRKRFPENCVQIKASIEEVLAASSEGKDLHPAVVMGPSRSSEGFRLFYLVEWLD